jgi:hypothetical protein
MADDGQRPEATEGDADMAVLLRRQYVQDRKEGREPGGYSVDDYAVVDGVRIGRIHREVQDGVPRWLWSLQAGGDAGPGQLFGSGVTDTLEQARAAVSARWAEMTEEMKKGG